MLSERRAALATLACTLFLSVGASAHKPPRVCPKNLNQRTPEQVMEQHRAALAVGNVELAMCDFDDDIVVIHDGGVDEGTDAVRNSLGFLTQLFGGSVPQVNDEVVVNILNNQTHMVRVLFSITTPCVTVADGADTYIVKNGKIQAQTSHAFPTFQCAPPGL